MHEPIRLSIDPHPLLDAGVFVTSFPEALERCVTPAQVRGLLRVPPSSAPPMTSDDAVRRAVRDLLRHGGYKPTGRGKPASEYLLGAVAETPLPEINVAVDTCNAVSLHSGLPISVVDLDRSRGPHRIGIATEGSKYVFNASGQEIDLAGLLCLFDADGPCANGVKDAQRTKTSSATRRTLSVVWGTRALDGRTLHTVRWYRELLEACGACTELATG
jgi:DNA/RNA-binding domain of Phe-tRNA-synthetase-like protein